MDGRWGSGGPCVRDDTVSRGSREVAPGQRCPGSSAYQQTACKVLYEACSEKPYATLTPPLTISALHPKRRSVEMSSFCPESVQ